MATPKHPKIVLLKGNGGITINNEMMELFTITTSHGMIGLPLKSLHASRLYIVHDLEQFWEIHKTIKEKPCCFIYSYEPLDSQDMKRINANEIKEII
ncbi:MAG: hypothetical protein JXQ76_07615 [Campylobacterales bacterium]|nr:hypothetical protein [Campylobacterales bacterium]